MYFSIKKMSETFDAVVKAYKLEKDEVAMNIATRFKKVLTKKDAIVEDFYNEYNTMMSVYEEGFKEFVEMAFKYKKVDNFDEFVKAHDDTPKVAVDTPKV